MVGWVGGGGMGGGGNRIAQSCTVLMIMCGFTSSKRSDIHRNILLGEAKYYSAKVLSPGKMATKPLKVYPYTL